tara:strand:+ start:856 stop:1551 length:696 start_codon:yes stop_codon:yes gene_type:complete
MTKAVVTYNFGDYDALKCPEWSDAEWDFLVFTDKPEYQVEGWETITLPEKWDVSNDPKRRANYVKYRVFNLLAELKKEYDLVVVMDANMVVVGPLDDFVNIFMMSSVDGVVLKSNRESVYEDLEYCEKFDKDDSVTLQETALYFREQGYPPKVNDYFQTGISVRRNSGAWRMIEERFQSHYAGYTKRDQPMMNFIHWKYPFLDLNMVDIKDIGEFIRYDKHTFEKDGVYST